jgi:ubiquitin-protein ligase
MHPRIKRLMTDEQRVEETFSGAHPVIKLIEKEGSPAERYVFEYNIKGIKDFVDGKCIYEDFFKAEIFLMKDYPRRPPFCRMLTQIFHPNIDAQKICIGDHWSAGRHLSSIIIEIAELISYQRYNVKSPLNGQAAAWTENNIDILPIIKQDFSAEI